MGTRLLVTDTVVVQSLSHFWCFVTLWAAACQASLSFTVSWTLLDSCPLSQWCHPTIFLCRLLLLSSVFPSIRVFSNALHIRWPKYWSFSFSIRPSSEFSGVISFRIDWFNLLAVKGTLKSLLQHQNSKASILWVVLLLWGFSGDSDGEKSAWSAGEPRSVPGSRRWDALENKIVTHSSIFAWRIPGQEPHGSYAVHKDCTEWDMNEQLSLHFRFFMVQLLHPYRAGGKTMALTIQTFVSKVISLVFFFFFFFLIYCLSLS